MSLMRRVSVLMRHLSTVDHPLIASMVPAVRRGLQNPALVKQTSRILLSLFGKRRRFSLIELLIAVSIIVTFSSLVGAVYLKKLEESKLSKAKIDINTIANSLIMYYTRTSRYPRQLENLVEQGDIRSVPTDPWDNPYQYVPQLDWNVIMRVIQDRSNERELKYYTDCIDQVARVVSGLPDKLDPMLLVAAAYSSAYVFSRGVTEPIFGPDVLNVPRDRIKAVAHMMRLCVERAAGVPQMQEALQRLIQVCSQRAGAGAAGDV
uniref:General secretion pathway protein G1 n=1 Tax=Malawimonas jakobiformis TaxID=136089 RepID=A0A895KNL9_MALJA|nr:general secretion pathway protein G1 [Malawimonas jakobiformis]